MSEILRQNYSGVTQFNSEKLFLEEDVAMGYDYKCMTYLIKLGIDICRCGMWLCIDKISYYSHDIGTTLIKVSMHLHMYYAYLAS